MPQSNIDGTSPSSSTTIVSNYNSSPLATNSPVPNSQNQSSSFCTVSKRSTKISNTDGLTSLNSNSLVQSTARHNKLQTSLTNPTTTTTTSNGHDENLSSYKQQQKKSTQKSSQQPPANSQSRRQAKKQEQVQTVSRDSSSSHVNGFGTTNSIENSDMDKT